MFSKIYSTVVQRVSVVFNLLMKEQIMKDQIVQFLRDEEGATAIEYGLIAGLISIGIIAGLTGIGTKLTAIFNKIMTEINKVTTS